MKDNKPDRKPDSQSLKRGDISAIRWIYQEYAGVLLNLAWRISGNKETAEDIIHDVFVKLPQKLKNWKMESAINTWLHRIVFNASIDHLRKEKRQNELVNRNEWLNPKELGPKDTSDLSFFLNQLTAHERALLWLKEAEGYDIKTLSEIFTQPEGTIKSNLSRSRKKLKETMIREKQNV